MRYKQKNLQIMKTVNSTRVVHIVVSKTGVEWAKTVSEESMFNINYSVVELGRNLLKHVEGLGKIDVLILGSPHGYRDTPGLLWRDRSSRHTSSKDILQEGDISKVLREANYKTKHIHFATCYQGLHLARYMHLLKGVSCHVSGWRGVVSDKTKSLNSWVKSGCSLNRGRSYKGFVCRSIK